MPPPRDDSWRGCPWCPRPLPDQAGAIVEKDAKTFVRDPAQWSQVFLLAAIAVITLVSVSAMPGDIFRGP